MEKENQWHAFIYTLLSNTFKLNVVFVLCFVFFLIFILFLSQILKRRLPLSSRESNQFIAKTWRRSHNLYKQRTILWHYFRIHSRSRSSIKESNSKGKFHLLLLFFFFPFYRSNIKCFKCKSFNFIDSHRINDNFWSISLNLLSTHMKFTFLNEIQTLHVFELIFFFQFDKRNRARQICLWFKLSVYLNTFIVFGAHISDHK